jgi:antirestriction protein
MANTIDNSLDIIDSRDVIARIEELEGELEGLTSLADAETANLADEYTELETLKSLADEASSYASDWHYGEALIRDTYFEDYAQELAEDCCEVPSNLSWPYTCIDWAKAARELQMDYSAVEFDGVTYWTR